MLSYPIPEAEELLTNKLSAAQQSLRNCEEDLDFLREQVTVRCSETFLFLLPLLPLLPPSDPFFVPGWLTLEFSRRLWKLPPRACTTGTSRRSARRRRSRLKVLEGGYEALLDLVKSGVEPTLLATLYYQQQQHGRRKTKKANFALCLSKPARSTRSSRAERLCAIVMAGRTR